MVITQLRFLSLLVRTATLMQIDRDAAGWIDAPKELSDADERETFVEIAGLIDPNLPRLVAILSHS